MAAGEPVEVDAVQRAAEGQFGAVVAQALGVHAGAHAGALQQVDRGLLQDAGADATQHVVGAALLDDDGVDAGTVQQRAQQQSGRTGADDGDLGSHGVSFVVCVDSRQRRSIRQYHRVIG